MSGKFALIIGNSQYQDPNLAKLVAPTEDVNDLANVLRDPAIGSFDQVITLVDETDATIRLSIEDFFTENNPNDLLVLYFSGHGVRDEQGRLYLAAPNTRSNRLRATAIAADYITGEMDRSRSRRQVLILDCCHSGAFAQGAKAVIGESAGTGPAFEGNGFGRVVLTATDATQYAWEGDKIIGRADNSLFTHFVIEGLNTGAADQDGDGLITLDEMYDYVYEQVITQTPKQTPGKWSYRQQGEIVIAKNPQSLAKVTDLPTELTQLVGHPLAVARESAVQELSRLLASSTPGLVLAARAALQKLTEDDSSRVRLAAAQALSRYNPPAVPPEEAVHHTLPRLSSIVPSRLVTPTGEQFRLQPGVNVIGRSKGLEIKLEQDVLASRRHAQIVVAGDRFTLEDLGSANGTFVNGERLTSTHILHAGDTLTIGNTALTFELKSVTPASSAPSSPPPQTVLEPEPAQTAIQRQVTESQPVVRSGEAQPRAKAVAARLQPRTVWLTVGGAFAALIIALGIVLRRSPSEASTGAGVLTSTIAVAEVTARPTLTPPPNSSDVPEPTTLPIGVQPPTATDVPTVAPTSTPPPTVVPTNLPAPTVAPAKLIQPTVAPTLAPPPTVAPTQVPPPTAVPTQAPPVVAVPTGAPALPAAQTIVVYAEGLAGGWEDWSYGAATDSNNGSTAHNGARSVAVTFTQGFGAFSPRSTDPIDTTGYSAIKFWVYAPSGDQPLALYTQSSDDGGESALATFTASSGGWTRIVVPLASLGSPSIIKRFAIQDESGGAQPTLFIDDLAIVP